MVIIKEALLGLVNGSLDHLSGASGARTGTATVRKVDSLFFSSVDNENIISAFDGLIDAFLLRNKLDSESEFGGEGRTGNRGKSGNSGGSDKESEKGLGGEHDEKVSMQ